MQPLLLLLREHLSRHCSMRQTVYIQIIVGMTDFHFLEENIRHIRIVVLSSVNNNFLYTITFGNGPAYHCRFYKLRAGTDNC